MNDTIAQAQYRIAIYTLLLVAVELLILVPAMLREISDFLNKSRKRKLRKIFTKLGCNHAVSFSRLRDDTHLRDEALQDALYALKELGEVKNAQSPNGEEVWMKIEPPRK